LRIIDKNVCNVANKCLNIGKCISANGKQIEKVKIGKRCHEGRGKGGKARGAMGRQGVEIDKFEFVAKTQFLCLMTTINAAGIKDDLSINSNPLLRKFIFKTWSTLKCRKKRVRKGESKGKGVAGG